MIKCNDWPVGLCSWSLRGDIEAVAEAMRRLKIEHVNLAVESALGTGAGAYIKTVRQQAWTISATMINFPQEDYSTLQNIKRTGGIVPDENWPENHRRVLGALDITSQLGVKYLLFHAGFIDHTEPDYYRKFQDRMRTLADAAAEKDIIILMETGQESAALLKRFLEELNHPALAVNFDPANMILYDMDEPHEAVRILAPWIRHLHVKDALRTQSPGTWGTEVPWGEGQVGGHGFLRVLKEIGFSGTLAIERETGDNQLEDIESTIQKLASFAG